MGFQNAVKEHNAIFKGKAKATKSDDDWVPNFIKETETYRIYMQDVPQVTTFQVIEAYKGVSGSEIKINHWSQPWGPKYAIGETYTVFAEKGPQGDLYSGFCSPSIPGEGGPVDRNAAMADLSVFREQAEKISAMVAAAPQSPDSYIKKATFYEEYKDYANAAEAFQTSVKLKKAAVAPEIGIKETETPDEKRLQCISLSQSKRFDELQGSPLDCSGAELESLDLSGLKMTGLNLSGTKIMDLTLENAQLDGANFTGAKIRGLKIKNSRLEKANFSGAELSGVIADSVVANSNFSKTKLYSEKIDNADFSGSDFTDADLVLYADGNKFSLAGATLRGAYIHKLVNVDLTGAKLDGMMSRHNGSYPVEWVGVDFSGVDLSRADIRGGDLRNAKLAGTNLSGANLNWSFSKATDLRGIDLSATKLEGTTMILAQYDCHTKFPDGFLPEKHYMIPAWEGCEGKRPPISFAGLKTPVPGFEAWGEPSMKEADLSGVSFAGSEMDGFGCNNCNLQGADFSDITIKLVLRNCDLRGAKFTNTSLAANSYIQDSDLHGVDFSTIKLVSPINPGMIERGLSLPSFRNSLYDDQTKWPEKFGPSDVGAKLAK